MKDCQFDTEKARIIVNYSLSLRLSILKSAFEQMKQLYRFLLPANRSEGTVLLASFLCYALLAAYIVFTTYLNDSKQVFVNVYLGFDTQSFVTSFYSSKIAPYLTDVAHPFYRVLMSPMVILSVVIKALLGYKAKTFFLTLITSLFVSGSLMLIFRYLRSFLRLNLFRTLLLLVIAAFTSTFLIISFTPESYPASLFLLTFVVTYYSFQLRDKKDISLGQFVAMTLITCGTTITNGAKCFVMDLFAQRGVSSKWRRWLKAGAMIAIVFVVYYTAIITGYSAFKGGTYLPWEDAVEQFAEFGSHLSYPEYVHASYLEMRLSYFFGTPLLLGETVMGFNKAGRYILYTAPYAHLAQYAFVLLLLGIIVYSFGKNLRNRFAMMLFASFAVDLFIHVMLGFGIYEAFIYGSHWVFLVPLMFGWVYSQKGNANANRVWDVVFVLIALVLIPNNIIKLIDLIQFGQHYYPV